MKIPDDVFDTRCRYCIHRKQGVENKDIPEDWLWKQWHRDDMPCEIFGISHFDQIPGECVDFYPNYIFGICLTCGFSNHFADGFCTRKEQPNKHKLYIGCGGFAAGTPRPAYWRDHVLSTCDAYCVAEFWVDIIRRQAAEGRIPRNFDPETMKPIGKAARNETAEKWAEIDRQQQEAKKAEAEAAAARQRALDPPGGQFTLFDSILQEGGPE